MMKKYDLLYGWPIDAIRNWIDAAETSAFAESLVEPLATEFALLVSRFDTLAGLLEAALASRRLFSGWPDLDSLLSELAGRFPSAPGIDVVRFQTAVALLERVVESLSLELPNAPEMDETEIDPSVFIARRLKCDDETVWFAHENQTTLKESLVIVNGRDPQKLRHDLVRAAMTTDLLLSCVAVVVSTAEPCNEQLVICKAEAELASDGAVIAAARLALIADGRHVHVTRHYSHKPKVAVPESISVGRHYQQFEDVLYVLSESNSRTEVLMKYLTLYHVIENFMVRSTVVALERAQGNGQLFSIRDFQRLNEVIDKRELSALEGLCAAVFKLNATTTQTFEQRFVAGWEALAIASGPALDAALSKFRMRFDKVPATATTFAASKFASRFATLVYAVRNAIVHNKATEFHLTYATLDGSMQTLLEDYLIPTLEELCFGLIVTENDELWFSRSKLMLYAE